MPEELAGNGRNPRLPRSAYLRPLLRLAAMGALLFVPAGTLAWSEGLAYFALYALWSALTTLLLALRSPALLRLRETDRPSSPYAWDRFFSSAGGVLLTTALFICGAEGAQAEPAPAATAAGFAAVSAAYVLAGWALLANPDAAGAVLVRDGQRVAAAGPYAVVRHPLYLAGILFFLATPAALGSAYAFIPSGLLAAATAARTALEDRLLLRELPGYADYAERVPCRLLPGIW